MMTRRVDVDKIQRARCALCRMMWCGCSLSFRSLASMETNLTLFHSLFQNTRMDMGKGNLNVVIIYHLAMLREGL